MSQDYNICELCKGEVYPRQCRNLKGFRRRQRAPIKCPYAIPLNNLPVGDNVPAGLSAEASAKAGPDPCPHLQVITVGSCCKTKLYCWLHGSPRKIDPGACRACARNTEPALIGAATHG